MLKKFKFSFFILTEKFWNYINNKQTWTPKAKPSMDEWKVKAHISKNDLKISCLFILSSLLLVYARIVEFFRCLQALSFIFISPAFTYSFTESEIDLEFEKKTLMDELYYCFGWEKEQLSLTEVNCYKIRYCWCPIISSFLFLKQISSVRISKVVRLRVHNSSQISGAY